MGEDGVWYLQCPHCKKGWYGKLVRVTDHYDKDGQKILDEFVIQGINPTNLTEPIYCLNCHKYYIPLEKEYTTWHDPKTSEIIECIQLMDCKLYYMDEFVAKRLTTCQGS